jgi:hypothetical protein
MSASLLTQTEPETHKLTAKSRIINRVTQRLAEMGIALDTEHTVGMTYKGIGNGNSYSLQLVKEYPDSLSDDDVKREANELVAQVAAGVAGTVPAPPLPKQDIDERNRKIDREPEIKRAEAKRQRKRDRGIVPR